MSNIERLVSEFKAWVEPRDGVGDNPFRLACWLDGSASEEEVAVAWGGRQLPADLYEFWQRSRAARLFEDIDYGQWGLKLLSPAESADRTAAERSERPADIETDDVVIGEFLGDQELLVLAGDGPDAGVLVALPLDPRTAWYHVAVSLTEFLDRYLEAAGDKFWESSARGLPDDSGHIPRDMPR